MPEDVSLPRALPQGIGGERRRQGLVAKRHEQREPMQSCAVGVTKGGAQDAFLVARTERHRPAQLDLPEALQCGWIAGSVVQ